MIRLFRARAIWRAILAVLCSHFLCRLGARAEVMDWSRRARQILTHGGSADGFWDAWSGQAPGPFIF